MKNLFTESENDKNKIDFFKFIYYMIRFSQISLLLRMKKP